MHGIIQWHRGGGLWPRGVYVLGGFCPASSERGGWPEGVKSGGVCPDTGINSLLHSVNLTVFTLLLFHLFLRISPHHSHPLSCHHLSLPPPFTPDFKISSLSQILSSIATLILSGLPSRILTCTVSKEHCVVCFSFFFWLRVIDTAEYSAFESTLNSSTVSYWYNIQQYSYYIRNILTNIHGRSSARNSLFYSGRAIC